MPARCDPLLQETLRTIGRCRAGREVLEAFLSRHRAGILSVQWLRADERLSPTLVAPGTERWPASGAFIYESRHVQKIVASQHPRGEVQAAILFHELVHATDLRYLASFEESERLWKLFRDRAYEEVRTQAGSRGLSEEEIFGEHLSQGARLELVRLKRRAEHYDASRLIAAERLAYRKVLEWVSELETLSKETRRIFIEAKSEGFTFDYLPNPTEILNAYGYTDFEAA